MGIFRIFGGLCVASVFLSGCAYMGAQGSTRADAARALGMSPDDVVILSTAYSESGPRPSDFALANYTVKTSAGVTYVCAFASAPDIQDPTQAEPVCKKNH